MKGTAEGNMNEPEDRFYSFDSSIITCTAHYLDSPKIISIAFPILWDQYYNNILLIDWL